MSKKRVYELAKDLGTSPQTLIATLHNHGVDISHSFNVLDEKTVAQARCWYRGLDVVDVPDSPASEDSVSVSVSSSTKTVKSNTIAVSLEGEETDTDFDIEEMPLADVSEAHNGVHMNENDAGRDASEVNEEDIASTTGEQEPPEFVLVNLGRRHPKRVKKLRKGRGPLMQRVHRMIDDMKAEGALAQDAQTLIVIVEPGN